VKCKLVDVFADQKFNGNGLTVFYDFDALSQQEMQTLTREMKQFESIFLQEDDQSFRAHIFTEQEELDFAGHPLLGLCLHLHDTYAVQEQQQWQVRLNKQTVTLRSDARNGKFSAAMDQGEATLINELSRAQSDVFYKALGLIAEDISYPAQVITTGLAYLVLPVDGGLENIAFQVSDLTPLLEKFDAKFLYVIDIGIKSQIFEGRTWDNHGRVEDIATGSAAGPVAAYLYWHKLSQSNELIIHQGRFVHRPSEIQVTLECKDNNIENIVVSGSVVKVADIVFN
jgi:PhzF family phenazine biosynthesis protein